jgi:hypothetical protein
MFVFNSATANRCTGSATNTDWPPIDTDQQPVSDARFKLNVNDTPPEDTEPPPEPLPLPL